MPAPLFRRGQALTARFFRRMIADTFMSSVIGGRGINIIRMGDKVIVSTSKTGPGAAGTFNSRWVNYSS